ncbi:MAG: fibronectin type III domain-containing protein, partial [Acidimicrobiales bacterium]
GFTVSWVHSAVRDGYEVEWKASTSGTYTNFATTSSDFYAITGLSVLTTYDVRVRAYAGTNWKSGYAGPVSRFCPL